MKFESVNNEGNAFESFCSVKRKCFHQKVVYLMAHICGFHMVAISMFLTAEFPRNLLNKPALFNLFCLTANYSLKLRPPKPQSINYTVIC